MTSISNIDEGRHESALTAMEIRFLSRVEKSKCGTECPKVDGIPPITEVTGILPARS